MKVDTSPFRWWQVAWPSNDNDETICRCHQLACVSSGAVMILAASCEFDRMHNAEVQDRPSDNEELPQVCTRTLLATMLITLWSWVGGGGGGHQMVCELGWWNPKVHSAASKGHRYYWPYWDFCCDFTHIHARMHACTHMYTYREKLWVHLFGLLTGWSHIRVVSCQGGLSAGCFTVSRVVSCQDGLSAGWSLSKEVTCQGGLSWGWSVSREVSCQGGLWAEWSRLMSGWSIMRVVC